MLVPYRLRISLKDPDPETLARIRARRGELRKAEREWKLEQVRAYVKEGLSLENVRVAPGERFGQTVRGVFGTIVNRGARTLRKVEVRVYFLDADRRRIGEKDYAPVLQGTSLRELDTYDFGLNRLRPPGRSPNPALQATVGPKSSCNL